MLVRLIVGAVLTVTAFWVAGRRLWTLYRLGRAGQDVAAAVTDPRAAVQAEAVEVLGQRKLLTWSLPGAAHFFTFWGFLILGLTILEAYGALLWRNFHIPLIGTWPVLGFVEDFFAVAVLVALAVFALIRVRRNPARTGRASRFFGSHTGAAWLVLFMIFNVIWTLLLYRGAQIDTGYFPYRSGAFASQWVADALSGLGRSTLDVLETVGILAQLAVVLGFLCLVVYSKHLHIFLAPANVFFSRRPNALGPLLPMHTGKRPIDFEDPAEDDVFGRGKVEDFTWKGLLDFATCTECGRCQSQCPAWNTAKPLSPKLLVMDLRDHAFAKAPYLLAGGEHAQEEALAAVPASARAEAERPLVGPSQPDEHRHSATGGVIDPDVLWSCTTCGACVQQCPVDIEHVDHIVDMRRFQVMIESSFPAELGGLFKNMESKGNPWGMNASARMDWATDLPFEVRVVQDRVPDDVQWLFWVGCAGAYEDRARRTTRAVAELLHTAGVSFAVLGQGETCTGDSARRSGNEFLFQMLAQQNVETLNGVGATKIVATCAHCFNTLRNEYPQLGGRYEVVHHTQLLNRLVREGRLTPVAPVDGDRPVTYHDPCYLGRHNKVYAPPRELVGAIPGATLTELPRHGERSFCCGAGGARMWMEEKIGKRINTERSEEVVATGAAAVAVACPFCQIMISDGVSSVQSELAGDQQVQVLDIAQLLLRSVRTAATHTETGSGTATGNTSGVERGMDNQGQPETRPGTGPERRSETGSETATAITPSPPDHYGTGSSTPPGADGATEPG